MPPPPFAATTGPDWRVALTAALGMLAVYVLLPRPRRLPALAGAGLAVVALGLAAAFGLFPAWRGGPAAAVIETVLFYAFAFLALAGGVLLVTQTNPARGAISFALVVMSTCGLFLLQAAPFLMAGTVIIYAGAIIVTFLFVIMLSQQHEPTNADARSREPLLACLAGFCLLATLLVVLRQTYDTRDLDSLLARVDAARGRATADEMRAALGSEGDFTREVEQQADASTGRPAAWVPVLGALDELKEAWPRNDAAVLKARLDRFYTVGTQMKSRVGTLPVPEAVRLSAFSGPGPNQPGAGKGLPADNVAALGRSLFSDYLLAVELAGTLLLVATVGAIAIAYRPATGRRAA